MISKASLPFGEFIVLMASMSALIAMSTDAMLPALALIGEDLGVRHGNSTQLIISHLFTGMAVGMFFYGPLSDSIGRKPTIHVGYALFICGCLLSIFIKDFQVMLLGRLLQGLGVAGPRVVTVALIRDQYKGRTMARVLSFVMMVSIIVPVIAPAFGQVILMIANWRAIFGAFLALAILTLIWFSVRQSETLSVDKRIPFSFKGIIATTYGICTNRIAFGYTISSGLILGTFLGYLNLAQQVFQGQYGIGAQFPLYFGIISLSIGCASFFNGRLVMRYGMRFLCKWAVLTFVVVSVIFSIPSFALSGNPPFSVLMIYFMTSFFCHGILFGNLNALAMEPLGHMAGLGAAVVGSLSTFLGVVGGMLIGQSYNGTITPMVVGYIIFGILTMLVMGFVERGKAMSQ